MCGVIQFMNIQFLENNTMLMVAVSWLLRFSVTDFFKENNISEDSTTENHKIPLGTVFSIVIPWADDWQDKKMISESLKGWGEILEINICKNISKCHKIAYKTVFIHFKTWNNKKVSDCTKEENQIQMLDIKEHLLSCNKDGRTPEIHYPYGYTGWWNIKALISFKEYSNGKSIDEARQEAKICENMVCERERWEEKRISEKEYSMDDEINLTTRELLVLYIKHIYDRENESMSDKLNSIMHAKWFFYKTRYDLRIDQFPQDYCPACPEAKYSLKWPFESYYQR